jgi:NADH-quinone oxidoreductase subunit J
VVATVLAIEMGLVAYTVAIKGAAAINTAPMTPDTQLPNAETIGRVLYTDYAYFFQAAGLVLLVAMIGAIVLTLRHKPHVRRQVIADQVARTPATGMTIVQIKSGEGIAE